MRSVSRPPAGSASGSAANLSFVVSIGGFTLSSMLCASATTLDQIVLYRILQGLLSAPILPLSQAIMLDTYPRERHSFAITIWSIAMILGPVFGPFGGRVPNGGVQLARNFLHQHPVRRAGPAGLFVHPCRKPISGPNIWTGWGSSASAWRSGRFSSCWTGDSGRIGSSPPRSLLEATLAAFALYVFIVHSATTRRPYLNFAISPRPQLRHRDGVDFPVRSQHLFRPPPDPACSCRTFRDIR